jgi:hypothetical protein
LREKGDVVSSEDLFYWELREIYRGRLWKLSSVSTGAPLGNLEGVSFTGGLEREYKSALLTEILSLWEPGRRVPLLETLKAMYDTSKKL